MIDITAMRYFLPLMSFAFSALIIFAILEKAKILDNKGINITVALIIGFIFASLTDARAFIEALVPIFSVLFIILFMILLLGAFASGDIKTITKPGLAWTIIGIMIAFILYQSFFSFHLGANPTFVYLKDNLFRGEVAGSVWLAITAIVIGFWVTWK